MTEKKLTPWFPATVKPARRGVYERQYIEAARYCFWNGRAWGFNGHTPDEAKEMGGFISYRQDLMWRGLAEKPE